MISDKTAQTTQNVRIRLVTGLNFGPAPGWGTALGVLILTASVVVWLNAQSIVVGLMNGGHVTEASVSTTLETIRRNAVLGSATGSVFSLRVAVALLQTLLFGLSQLTRSKTRNQQSAELAAFTLRNRRYATEVDTGGGTPGLLTRTQQLLAGLPIKTAAFVKSPAVFFWQLFSAIVTVTAQVGLGVAQEIGTALIQWPRTSYGQAKYGSIELSNFGGWSNAVMFGFGSSIGPGAGNSAGLSRMRGIPRYEFYPWDIRMSSRSGMKGMIR